MDSKIIMLMMVSCVFLINIRNKSCKNKIHTNKKIFAIGVCEVRPVQYIRIQNIALKIKIKKYKKIRVLNKKKYIRKLCFYTMQFITVHIVV